MKLRLDASLSEFLRQAKRCEGDVFFETPEGDRLNIKSQLSQYVFLAAANSRDNVLSMGNVVCARSQDEERLQAFLIAAEG